MNIIQRLVCLYNQFYYPYIISFSGNDTSATKLYESAQFIVHANFDADTYVNDIAIIKTVEEIQFSMDVSPACLPFKYSEVAFNGFDVIALGSVNILI